MKRAYSASFSVSQVSRFLVIAAALCVGACTPETTENDPRVSGLVVPPEVQPNPTILLDQRSLAGRNSARPAAAPAPAPETAPAATEPAPASAPAATPTP